MIVIDFSTLCTLGTTTTIACDDEIRISSDTLMTTLTSSTTTATMSDGPFISVYAESARNYVSSMSDNELDDLIAQIDEKIDTLDNNAKVKSIGTMPVFKK